MIKLHDSKLFLDLLHTSGLFDDKGKMVIAQAVEDKVFPLVDFEYIFKTLKLEQNLMHVIDIRSDAILQSMKKKYSVSMG